jgi:HEAT repeat protein
VRCSFGQSRPSDPLYLWLSGLAALFSFSLLLIGCLQEAPAPSAGHTAALLISLLHDESFEVRRTAAESLGKIGDPSAVASLLPLLTDPVPVVRAAAAQALGRMGAASDEAVVAGLSRSLEDPDDAVKLAAATAIGEIEPSSRLLKPVVNLVHASDVHVRRAAIRALLEVDTSLWTPLLLPALEDPDTEVRQAAVAVLGESGSSHVRTEIQKRFVQDQSPAVRAEAAYHMAEVGGSETRSVLQSAFEKDPDRGVKRWIEAELNSLRGSD